MKSILWVVSFMVIAVLTLGVGRCEMPSASRSAMSRDADMDVEECLERHRITVRVGHREIAPEEGAMRRILEAVQVFRERAQLPGVPDEFNIAVLDSTKVESFFGYFPKLPGETLDRLDGRILYLNDSSLHLHSASAVSATTLASGYRLQVKEGRPGEIADVKVDAAVDRAFARERAAQARKMALEMDVFVKGLEERVAAGASQGDDGGALLRDLSRARAARYSYAAVWRNMAVVLARLDPKDATLESEVAAASDAAARFLVPPWVGMP